jgi:hypothetical protein
MNDTLFIVGIVLLMIVSWYFIPQFLNHRAIKQVVKILTKNNCFSAQTAKTPRDLGLAQRSWISNLGSTRNYKPRALQTLIEYDIVQKTPDDRVYLVKEKLALYKLG